MTNDDRRLGMEASITRRDFLNGIAIGAGGVLASRLAGGPIDAAAWNQLVTPWKVPAPAEGYQPKGCLECRNTGYYGRQGIYEILLLSEPVQELLSDQVGLDPIRRQAMKEGMRTLRLAGAQRVAAGETTIEEVMRVAPAVQIKG